MVVVVVLQLQTRTATGRVGSRGFDGEVEERSEEKKYRQLAMAPSGWSEEQRAGRIRAEWLRGVPGGERGETDT